MSNTNRDKVKALKKASRKLNKLPPNRVEESKVKYKRKPKNKRENDGY